MPVWLMAVALATLRTGDRVGAFPGLSHGENLDFSVLKTQRSPLTLSERRPQVMPGSLSVHDLLAGVSVHYAKDSAPTVDLWVKIPMAKFRADRFARERGKSGTRNAQRTAKSAFSTQHVFGIMIRPCINEDHKIVNEQVMLISIFVIGLLYPEDSPQEVGKNDVVFRQKDVPPEERGRACFCPRDMLLANLAEGDQNRASTRTNVATMAMNCQCRSSYSSRSNGNHASGVG